MCLYDIIVLFYAFLSKHFHLQEKHLPRISHFSLFQYENSLNSAHLVTPSLALLETYV